MRKFFVVVTLVGFVASLAGATDALAKKRHRRPVAHDRGAAAPTSHAEPNAGQMSHPGGGSNSK
jgi:hypothetical protein